MAKEDDERAAASLHASLATGLIGAAVAVVTFVSAIDVFMADKRVLGCGFWWWTGAGFATMLAAMIFGAFGISRNARSGAGGNWNNPDLRWGYSLQAILTVAG